MNIAKHLLSGVLAAALVVAAPELLAQFPGGGKPGGMGGRSRGGSPPSGGIQAPRPGGDGNTFELVEFRLDMLEEDLKLTPNQMKIWDAYAERVRAMATDIVRDRAPAQSIASPTAMQQMNRAVDTARNRLAALEDIATAAKTFYDVLTPEQKMLADSRFATILPLIAGGPQQNSARGTAEPAPDGAFGKRQRDGARPD